jgi:cardiolipin synthase
VPRRWKRRWRLERLQAQIGAPVFDGHRVSALVGGKRAVDGMLEAISGAVRGVAVEMYTWSDDRLGRRVAQEVARRARAGVAVHVMIDAFGSFGSEGIVELLTQAGARVRWYHPLAPWTPQWYPNRRNHRKLVLVDGTTAFVGGINLSEAYSEEYAGPAAWRDLMLRVDGPAVREMARMFIETWARMGGPLDAVRSVIARPRPCGSARVQVVGGRGLLGRRSMRRAYLALLSGARERIFLANAYFAPDAGLRRALAGASRRGVRVELLLPGTSDVPFVVSAGRASYERLLSAGVAVREMDHAVLHAKLAVFDKRVLLAGSANLDHRSFRHNLEIAVSVFEDGVVTDALRAFEAEYAQSRPVLLAGWTGRPLLVRLHERLSHWLRYWI